MKTVITIVVTAALTTLTILGLQIWFSPESIRSAPPSLLPKNKNVLPPGLSAPFRSPQSDTSVTCPEQPVCPTIATDETAAFSASELWDYAEENFDPTMVDEGILPEHIAAIPNERQRRAAYYRNLCLDKALEGQDDPAWQAYVAWQRDIDNPVTGDTMYQLCHTPIETNFVVE